MLLDDIRPRIERLLNQAVSFDGRPLSMSDLIAVNAQNVYDYYIQLVEEECGVAGTTEAGGRIFDVDESFLSRHFVCPVPPWHCTWYEWKQKNRFGVGQVGVLLRSGHFSGEPAGKLLRAMDLQIRTQLAANGFESSKVSGDTAFPDTDVAHFAAIGTVYVGLRGSSISPQTFVFVLGEDGSVILGGYRSYQHSLLDIPELGNITFSGVVDFVNTLANCKNSRLIDQPISERLNRSRIKKGKAPLITFRTLDIVPMQQTLRQAAQENGVTGFRALHICRGHFKDYRRGAGLFGKYQGLYWWDMHARGSVENGEVKKSYRVLTPS